MKLQEVFPSLAQSETDKTVIALSKIEFVENNVSSMFSEHKMQVFVFIWIYEYVCVCVCML